MTAFLQAIPMEGPWSWTSGGKMAGRSRAPSQDGTQRWRQSGSVLGPTKRLNITLVDYSRVLAFS
jgi:hypothetical protein